MRKVPMKKALNPLELKLQVVVSHPTWMLQTELPASTRATSVLNSCAISSALKCLFIDCGYFTTLSSKKIETLFLKICVDVSYFQSGKFAGVPGSIWEAVVGGSIQVWGQPRLYSKFRASRGYITRLRKKEEFLNTPGNEQTAVSIEKDISGKLEANKA